MKKKHLFLLLALLLAGGAFFYLRIGKLKDFEPRLIATLQSLVRKGTDSLYQLSIEKMQVDVVNAKIHLVNVSFRVDSTVLLKLDSAKGAPQDLFSISVNALTINGLGPADLLDKKSIRFNKLLIDTPIIEVFHHKRQYHSGADKKSATLYDQIRSHLEAFSLDSLLINKVSFIHHNVTKNKKTELKDVSFQFQNILIDSSTAYDSSRFLFAEKALIAMNNYSFRTADGMYFLKANSVSIVSPGNLMQVRGFSLQPAVSKSAFDKKNGYRKERYDISIKELELRAMNWWSLLNQEEVTAQKMKMADGKIRVSLDRSLPAAPTSKVGNYPHQLLRKLEYPVMVDTIAVTGLDIVYEELNLNSGKVGTVYFDNTSATITNTTNRQEKIEGSPQLTIHARTSFMHEAVMEADFSFDLAQHRQGKFQVEMHMSEITPATVEKIATPLALFAIKSASIKSLHARINGTNTMGRGTVTLLYNNLKIVPLKMDHNSKGGFKPKKLQGFIFNTFVIKDSNPARGENQRRPTVEFMRENDKSFFNLVWKTILVGILKTVGAPPSLAKSK